MTGMRNIEEEEEEDLPEPGETGTVFEEKKISKIPGHYINMKLFQTCALDPTEPISGVALQQAAVRMPNVFLTSLPKVVV